VNKNLSPLFLKDIPK